MVVLYTMGVRLNTDTLVQDLPLTDSVIKIEKQGVLKRGSSKRDLIKRRVKAEIASQNWTEEGYYRVLNPFDKELMKAVSCFK